jgi:hypothetical protein
MGGDTEDAGGDLLACQWFACNRAEAAPEMRLMLEVLHLAALDYRHVKRRAEVRAWVEDVAHRGFYSLHNIALHLDIAPDALRRLMRRYMAGVDRGRRRICGRLRVLSRGSQVRPIANPTSLP